MKPINASVFAHTNISYVSDEFTSEFFTYLTGAGKTNSYGNNYIVFLVCRERRDGGLNSFAFKHIGLTGGTLVGSNNANLRDGYGTSTNELLQDIVFQRYPDGRISMFLETITTSGDASRTSRFGPISNSNKLYFGCVFFVPQTGYVKNPFDYGPRIELSVQKFSDKRIKSTNLADNIGDVDVGNVDNFLKVVYQNQTDLLSLNSVVRRTRAGQITYGQTYSKYYNYFNVGNLTNYFICGLQFNLRDTDNTSVNNKVADLGHNFYAGSLFTSSIRSDLYNVLAVSNNSGTYNPTMYFNLDNSGFVKIYWDSNLTQRATNTKYATSYTTSPQTDYGYVDVKYINENVTAFGYNTTLGYIKFAVRVDFQIFNRNYEPIKSYGVKMYLNKNDGNGYVLMCDYVIANAKSSYYAIDQIYFTSVGQTPLAATAYEKIGLYETLNDVIS